MQTSAKCLTLIRVKEELSLKAYLCPAGKWTIGYGHTGPDVHEGMTITIDQAISLFRADVAKAEAEVRRLINTGTLTQGMFDCLVSFEFNTGGLVLKDGKHSKVLLAVNERRWNDVVEALVQWNIAGGEDSRGLLIRRLEESLFFTNERYPV